MEYGRYEMIYRFYVSRIMNGYFKSGEVLPTVEQMSEKFSVAPETARKALNKLKKDGYIRLSSGKRTTIKYHTSAEEIKRYTKDYFLARKDEISNLNHVSMIVITPLLKKGCDHLEEQDFCLLSEVSANIKTEVPYLSFLCCMIMLNKLNNRLVNNLFYEIMLFYQFPCIACETDSFDQKLKNDISSSCKKLDHSGLWNAFQSLQNIIRQVTLSYITESENISPKPKQISFRWQIDRDRPQLLYSVISKLIYEVITDEALQIGDFLPSCSAMAKKYNVSVSTIRRSVDLLADLGMVQTINGVGTKVIPYTPNWDHISRPVMQKNISLFLQGIKIIKLTCDNVVSELFNSFPDSQVEKLKTTLYQQIHSCVSFQPLFDCLQLILNSCMHTTLYEIYQRLCEIMLWGFPLLEGYIKSHTDSTALPTFAQNILYGLEIDDSSIFCHGLKGLITEAIHIMEKLQQLHD